MAKYGSTWWGQEWLNALSHIGYANRLPRGRSYAGNGAVKDIQFVDNHIKARVQGRRPSPYKIELSLPAFSKQDTDDLVRIISGNPHLLSRLLNRELPTELNELAQRHNIQIFPRSKNDLNMHCSCPDWAVPCKHIAAVIYIIANEIDRNPFIVFQLHGIDILHEIEQRGFIANSGDALIPRAADYFGEAAPDTRDQPAIAPVPDLSTIPDLREQLMNLLDDQQLFYSGNFKVVLRRMYQAVAKESARRLTQISDKSQQESIQDFVEDYEKYQEVAVILSNEVFYFDTILTADSDERHFSRPEKLSDLIAYLEKIPARYADRLSPGLFALYQIYYLALVLMRQSAYTPQILQLANKNYILRWIPAQLNELVKTAMTQLAAFIPPRLVQMINASYETLYLTAPNQALTLISLFIDYYINTIFGHTLKPTQRWKTDPNDQIDRFFFTYSTVAFTEIGEKEIPGTIYQFLSPYYLTHRDYVPLIKVEDDQDNYFTIRMMVENRKDALQEPVSLHRFLTGDEFKNHKIGVLQSLSGLIRHFADLERLLAASGQMDLSYDADDFANVLLRILPTVKLLGINILLPPALRNLVRPQTSLSLSASKDVSGAKNYLDLGQMLHFEWQVALGDETLAVDEFLRLVEGLSGVVRIKNQYVLVDREAINRLLKNLTREAEMDAADLLKIGLAEEYQGAHISISTKARRIMANLLKTAETPLPFDLKAHLRPYQQRGYEWLYRNAKIGFGSIIADDMGLGKTVQVIATILRLKEEQKLTKNKGLIIVPTTLLSNWANEIEKFAPTLRYRIYHGAGRAFHLDDSDVLITTYGILRSDEEQFKKKRWALVVIDEAQNIKNPITAQSKAIKKLKAPVKIAMSGTPVENRLSEYWSIFDFINKGYLGSLKYFKDEFGTPIEAYRDQKALDKFKRITTPFILRRLKTDKNIISDLPDKIENDTYVNLTKEQTALYQNVVDAMMRDIEAVAENSGIKRQGMVFKLMTALKQICNHPNQFLKKDEHQPELSGKAMMLLNLIENIYEVNEKVIIFTQYKEMGDILQRMIRDKFHSDPLFLHGGTARKKRDTMVEEFQKQSHQRSFILSIKAGGTGLNLTAANHVIHYDLWWNPAVERQATDRAFRIGQERHVMVYRMITRGTFEEKINAMLTSKQELADLTVASGEKWVGDLSNTELKELVRI